MNKILKVMCFILFALFAGINTIYAQGQSPTGLVVDEKRAADDRSADKNRRNHSRCHH